MKLYLGNLSYEVTEEDLQEALKPFGTVDSVTVMIDKHTGRSKGFGFAEMPTASEAQAAIEGLNGKELKGRAMNVNEARPRVDRPDFRKGFDRGGGGFGGGRGGRGGGGYGGKGGYGGGRGGRGRGH